MWMLNSYEDLSAHTVLCITGDHVPIWNFYVQPATSTKPSSNIVHQYVTPLVIGHSVYVPTNTIRVTCPPSLVQYPAFITTRYSTEDQQFAMVKVPLHITFIIFVTTSCCQYILSSPFGLRQNSLSPRTPLLDSFINLNLPQTEI